MPGVARRPRCRRAVIVYGAATRGKGPTMTRNPLLGTWKLVELASRGADGDVDYLLGPDAVGYITYTADGRMSVSIMSADRARFASEDIAGGTAAEKATIAETYLSYCGPYEIRGNPVFHHVEVSAFPNWIGADQQRTFEIDGDRLLLTTPPLLRNGVRRTSHLSWERV